MTTKCINAPPYHKILMIDDERDICQLLTEYLSDYDVLTATDPGEALELYRNHKVFLVLTDHQLTQAVNGIQLSQQIAEIYPDKSPRCILITGFGDKALVEKAINNGMHGYIEKPFQEDTLRDVVAREFAMHKRDIDEEQIMVQTFFEEAGEFCDDLETLLMTLAHAPDNLKQIKRILHTLKGMAGLFADFKQMEQICHHTEDILPIEIEGRDVATAELTDVLVYACDETRSLINHLREDCGYRVDMPAVLAKIAVRDSEKANLAKDKAAVPGAALPATDKTDSGKKDGIYIPAGTLDQFMLSIGELISVRNFMENVLFDPLAMSDAKSYRGRIGDIYAQLSSLCHQLHNDVMEIRKVPIKLMFRPYLRIVRNLAIRTEKQIDMIINDHDIMVDTNIIKHLSDALIHILKNSIDHGIESPADRIAAGKSAGGTILIDINQDRTYTYISISDDGRGLNEHKIRAKALAKGLITESAAAAMTRDEVLPLILLPGFSTADTINEMSGRGIGLDAVKRATDDLGGTLTLDSQAGKGTAIALTIPQIKTININRMIIYRIRNQMFASKLADIRFVTSLRQVKIRRYDNQQEFIDFNGELINIAAWRPLGVLKTVEDDIETPDTAVVLIFFRGKESIAILADELMDIGQLVAGELDEPIDIKGFSGKTILKNGRPALIVTPQDLMAG